ncbi:MAG TPA: DUF4113 domain-containing protein, partial [Fimbriimonadaceae bacterium]|nr:DUF4113 domain-containing protein [Fimbriimonadaceae bacterium]
AKRPWKAHTRFPATQDTVTFTEELNRLWLTCDVEVPHKVGMVFYDLHEAGEVTPSLFDEVGARENLSRAVDTVNQKFGKNTIYLAALHEAKDTASEKIAFNKTWLFSEGKGDNQWSGGEEN